MRKHLGTLCVLYAATAALTACTEKPEPRSASLSSASDNCASARLPTDTSAAGALEGFAGEYTNGQLVLSFRQEGYRLLVGSAASGEREIRRVSDWRFEDSCGVTYQFSYPLDHIGNSLEISTPLGSIEKYQQIRSQS
jgi:hypothetical protein